jgi:HEAT repeat protein
MLGLSPLPRTLAAALRDVHEKKVDVRVSAVRDLARLAHEDDRAAAIQGLVSVLQSDKTPGVRAEAAIALADARAGEAVSALTRAATRDEAVRVRQMALVALGEVADDGDHDARAAIERTLSDRSPELRFQALIAFNRVGGAGAEAQLFEHMEDRDAHVRYVALRLAEERFVGDDVGREIPERVSALTRAALDDESAEVRLAAAILLTRGGDEAGRAELCAVVNRPAGGPEPEDEQAAIDLAGERGWEEARPGLVRRAFGMFGFPLDRFSWQARIALARLGDERAKLAILRGLQAWTRDARTVAVAAAGRARLAEARPAIVAMRGKPDRAAAEAVEEALQLLPEP